MWLASVACQDYLRAQPVGCSIYSWGAGPPDLLLPSQSSDSAFPACSPDLIFISAGFDAHRKDDINFRYIGIQEKDYEWLTDQIVQVWACSAWEGA